MPCEIVNHLQLGATVIAHQDPESPYFDSYTFNKGGSSEEVLKDLLRTAGSAQVNHCIALNHGCLILPGQDSTILLERLKFNQSAINHRGIHYQFRNVPSFDESWAVTRLDNKIDGELRRGLGTEVFFIPTSLSFTNPLKVNFVFRGFSSNELLANLEGRALEQFDIIHLEDLNELPDESYYGCLRGEISAEDYLEMFQKATGIKYRSGVVESLLERIKEAQAWYQSGKKIHRPIFIRKNDFTDYDRQYLDAAKKEHDYANKAFKQTPFGSIDFEKFIQLGKDYVFGTQAYNKARIRDMINAVSDRAIDVALSGAASPDMGFLVSTAFTVVADEVAELWKGMPIEVGMISLDSLALSEDYPETKQKFPSSPLVKARLNLVRGQATDKDLELMIAREAAFQVLRRKISVAELKNSALGTVEKDYIASLKVEEFGIEECRKTYNDFLASGMMIPDFI